MCGTKSQAPLASSRTRNSGLTVLVVVEVEIIKADHNDVNKKVPNFGMLSNTEHNKDTNGWIINVKGLFLGSNIFKY